MWGAAKFYVYVGFWGRADARVCSWSWGIGGGVVEETEGAQ